MLQITSDESRSDMLMGNSSLKIEPNIRAFVSTQLGRTKVIVPS